MARLRRTAIDLVAQLQEMIDDLYQLSTMSETDVRADRLVAGTIAGGTFIVDDILVSGVLTNPNMNQYVYFDATTGRYIETPDSATNSITGDIDIAVLIAPDDWSYSDHQCYINKYTGGQNSWKFDIQTSGALKFEWTEDGIHANVKGHTSTANLSGLANGTKKWIRVTMDVNNGAGSRVVKFYTADPTSETDPTPGSWSQLGSTIATAGTTNIWDSTATLQVGGWGNGAFNQPKGKFYGLLVNNAYETANLWTTHVIKFMVDQSEPTGREGWPMGQDSGLDDSPSPGPFTWTKSAALPIYVTEILEAGVGFAFDGQTGQTTINELISFVSWEEAATAVTASYADVISRTLVLPFAGENVIIELHGTAYLTDLGENETIFMQPRVVIGSTTFDGDEVSDSNPNATGGAGTLDPTGSQLSSDGTHSHGSTFAHHGPTGHSSASHGISGAPSVTLADKRVNLTTGIPFTPGGGAIYVAGDEITAKLRAKGTNYTGTPRFGLLVKVYRAWS